MKRTDRMPLKVLDVSRLRSLGWQPTIPQPEGIGTTYEWFLDRSVASLA